MICPKCGKTNDDGVTSCAFCGAKFTAMSAEVKKESGGFFQKHKTLVIVAIVLVILIAGGSVAGYFINASKNQRNKGRMHSALMQAVCSPAMQAPAGKW